MLLPLIRHCYISPLGTRFVSRVCHGDTTTHLLSKYLISLLIHRSLGLDRMFCTGVILGRPPYWPRLMFVSVCCRKFLSRSNTPRANAIIVKFEPRGYHGSSYSSHSILTHFHVNDNGGLNPLAVNHPFEAYALSRLSPFYAKSCPIYSNFGIVTTSFNHGFAL